MWSYFMILYASPSIKCKNLRIRCRLLQVLTLPTAIVAVHNRLRRHYGRAAADGSAGGDESGGRRLELKHLDAHRGGRGGSEYGTLGITTDYY